MVICKKAYSRPIFIYRATHNSGILSLTYFPGVKNWRFSSWTWAGVLGPVSCWLWVADLFGGSGAC